MSIRLPEKRIRAVIVDDESHCRETLEQQLAWCCPSVDVITKANHVDEALLAIEKEAPDLVFLDIEMPEKNGFDLIKSLDAINFEIIFTTAYDEFALEAFRVQAIDYLLKPIEEEQLIKAVEKATFLIQQENTLSQLHNLMDRLSNQVPDRTIVIPTSDGAEFVKLSEIIQCQADGGYTRISLDDGRTLILSKTLTIVEQLIDQPHFIRTHQSHLINAQYIRRYEAVDGGAIILRDGSRVPVSRSRRKAWKSWVDGL